MSSERSGAGSRPMAAMAPVRLAIVASVVLGFGVACGGGGGTTTTATAAKTSTTTPAPTTTTTSLPAGYSRFTDSVDHFSIAVPASWKKVDPSSPGATKAFQDMTNANPKLKTVFGNGPGDLASRGTKLLAIDVSTAADFAPNVNVIAKAALGATDSDLAGMASSARTEYQKIGATVTGSSTVAVAGHQALQLKVQLPITRPSGAKTTIAETQDLVAANDFVYIVTFAGTSPEFSTIESTLSVS